MMLSITALEARRKFGETLKMANAAPVEITRHGRRQRYVIMSAHVYELYEEIRQAHAEERVLTVMESAVAKALRGDKDDAFKMLRAGNTLMRRFLDATGDEL